MPDVESNTPTRSANPEPAETDAPDADTAEESAPAGDAEGDAAAETGDSAPAATDAPAAAAQSDAETGSSESAASPDAGATGDAAAEEDSGRTSADELRESLGGEADSGTAETTADTPDTEADADADAAEAGTDADAETDTDNAAESEMSDEDALRQRLEEADPSAAETAEGQATEEGDAGAEDAAAAEDEQQPQNAEAAQEEANTLAEEDRAAQSAAAAAGGTENAEVVEETVTEESSRSSDEEFETQMSEASSDDDEDDGENAEKLRTFLGGAALGALGAVAVDQLLRPNEQVATSAGDRVVLERNGEYRVLRNDDALLRQPGSDVTSYRYDDGSTRSVVLREDGTEIETIRAADGRVLRRTRTLPGGQSVLLFDDTQSFEDVSVADLPQVQQNRQVIEYRNAGEDELRAALRQQNVEGLDRSFSLNQVRNIAEVRNLVPEINVDSVNFDTGSAVIRPDEAEELSALGNAIRDVIDENPGEVFLIEGHTDAVGSAAMNLALSDRRAESVALALSEYFDVPTENMVVQGYGESDLLVETEADERANRRAAVRRITPLLTAQQ